MVFGRRNGLADLFPIYESILPTTLFEVVRDSVELPRYYRDGFLLYEDQDLIGKLAN